MNLTAEQIQENWNQFMGYIDKYISSPRREKLKEFYLKYQDRLILMPGSIKKEYHNSFAGGYIEHINRVIEASIRLDDLWRDFQVDNSYTFEEVVFSALNHDLGKMGNEDKEAYLPQTDQWRKDKLGENYTFNTEIEFMSVPDRSLYLLQTHGIEYTKNEMLAIKLHDGLYDEANKPYLMGFQPGQKLRCALPHIIHQADFLASRVEWEREWLPKFKNSGESQKKESTLPNKSKTPSKTKALGSIKSPGLNKAMEGFFK